MDHGMDPMTWDKMDPMTHLQDDMDYDPGNPNVNLLGQREEFHIPRSIHLFG